MVKLKIINFLVGQQSGYTNILAFYYWDITCETQQ